MRERRPPGRMSAFWCALKHQMPPYDTLTRMQGMFQTMSGCNHVAKRVARADCTDILSCRMAAQAGDMYAFGVLLWELAAGQAMFAGMPWAQVMGAITLRHSRPRLPPGRALPSGLEPAVRMCMATNPADRPSFLNVGPAPPAVS